MPRIKVVICPDCKGTGKKTVRKANVLSGLILDCFRCKGTGNIQEFVK